jgi:hypothetical protein
MVLATLWARFYPNSSGHPVSWTFFFALISSFSSDERTRAGLPDGLYSNLKSQFGQILHGLTMEDVVIFYGHLVCVTAILYI